jgi:hypothetical protein
MSWLTPEFFVFHNVDGEVVYDSDTNGKFMWADQSRGYDSSNPYFSYYLIGDTLADAKPFQVNASGILRGNDGDPTRYIGTYPWSGHWDVSAEGPYIITIYISSVDPLNLVPQYGSGFQPVVPVRFRTGANSPAPPIGTGLEGNWITSGGDGCTWTGCIGLSYIPHTAWRLTFCWWGCTDVPGIGATSIWENDNMDTPIGDYSKVGGENTGGTYGVDTLSDVSLSFVP